MVTDIFMDRTGDEWEVPEGGGICQMMMIAWKKWNMEEVMFLF